MKCLIIAEKKSVAENVSKCISKHVGKSLVEEKGFFQFGDVFVSWAQGHIFNDCLPNEYGFSFGDLKNMPVIVKGEWKKKILDGDNYRSRERILFSLFKKVDVVIHLGDTAREGQIIIDEILEQWKVDPFGSNIKRMWLKEPDQNSIRRAWDNLEPNENFRPYHDAAIARSRSDWMWGMTFTGMFTSLARMGVPNLNGMISIGRVRTPVQAILARREKEMRDFKPITHFRPAAIFRKEGFEGSIAALWRIPEKFLNDEKLLLEKSIATALLERLKIAGYGEVKSFDSTPKKVSQPLTYSLATLSQEAARRFDFTAEKTLEIAQKLYDGYGDQPFLTYPRTDCPYMSKESLPTVGQRLSNLAGVKEYASAVAGADGSIISPSWIEENDPRIEDHDALSVTPMATAERIATLPPDERKIFDLVAKRFIEQFYPAQEKLLSKAVIEAGQESFSATGTIETQAGWAGAFREKTDEDAGEAEDEVGALPVMTVGEKLPLKGFRYGETQTKKPSPYTDGTLLGAMLKPASLVDDPELRKKIRETAGLGTAATRKDIIESLIRLGYAARPNKSKKVEIRITPYGESIINAIPEEIKSIGMTAIWEGYLGDIVKKKISGASFIDMICNELCKLSETFIEKFGSSGIVLSHAPLKESIKPLNGDGEPCPACHDGVLKTIRIRSKSNPQKTLFALGCRKGAELRERGCDYLKVVDEKRDALLEKIAKMPPPPALVGDGAECPFCHSGKLKTKYAPARDGNIFSLLSCDNGECRKSVYSKEAADVEEDGTKCPKCSSGIFRGCLVSLRETNEKVKALLCTDGGVPNKACGNLQFPQQPVVTNMNIPKLPGDGKVCPKCGNGFMMSGERISHRTGRPYRALFCMLDEKNNGCKNIEFPERARS